MTDLLVGVISGIVASGIFAGLIVLYRKGVAWLSFRPFHKIWVPFTRQKTLIVLTGKQTGHTLKVSANEADAAKQIQELMKKNGRVDVTISESENIALENQNIVALGSESVLNEITCVLLSSLLRITRLFIHCRQRSYCKRWSLSK